MNRYLVVLIIFFTSSNLFCLELYGKASLKGKIVYLERHHIELAADGTNQKVETRYFNKDNQLFAKIDSDFTKNIFIPNYTFIDLRFDHTENYVLSSDGKRVLSEIKEKGKITNNEIQVLSNSLLGQGFNNYIVKNFDRILRKEEEIFLMVGTRGDQYRFTISVDKVTIDKAWITVRPSSFLLKAFLKPLKLIYDLKKVRLISYEGLSNLEDENRDSQDVLIEYEYSN